MQSLILLAGRALLALLFIAAGGARIAGPKPFLAHMAEAGVPGVLLPAVIALEIVAGVAMLLGFQLKYSAGALGLFCILTAVVFHRALGIPAERTLFFKDLALAGGLIFIAGSAMATASGTPIAT